MKRVGIGRHGTGGFDETARDVLGAVLGLLFFLADLWLLDADREPNLPLHDTEGMIIRGLLVAILFLLSSCLVIPSRLYEIRVRRAVGGFATAVVASVKTPLTGLQAEALLVVEQEPIDCPAGV